MNYGVSEKSLGRKSSGLIDLEQETSPETVYIEINFHDVYAYHHISDLLLLC